MISINYVLPPTGLVAPTTVGTTLIFDVTATDDNDTQVTVPHRMPWAPLKVELTMLVIQELSALSNWSANWDANNVNLVKLASPNSGTPDPQLRVVVELPHSILARRV